MDQQLLGMIYGAVIAIVSGLLTVVVQHQLNLREDQVRRVRDEEARERLKQLEESLRIREDILKGVTEKVYQEVGHISSQVKLLNSVKVQHDIERMTTHVSRISSSLQSAEASGAFLDSLQGGQALRRMEDLLRLQESWIDRLREDMERSIENRNRINHQLLGLLDRLEEHQEEHHSSNSSP